MARRRPRGPRLLEPVTGAVAGAFALAPLGAAAPNGPALCLPRPQGWLCRHISLGSLGVRVTLFLALVFGCLSAHSARTALP